MNKEFVKNVKQLLLDIHNYKNEPEIIQNHLESFLDDNVEILQELIQDKPKTKYLNTKVN